MSNCKCIQVYYDKINKGDKMTRKNTRKVFVGDVQIGGSDSVVIQSMTTTRTSDVEMTVKQINELAAAGCQIVRVAVLDMDDAKSIGEIKKQINIPLVADIHFDYRLAIEAIHQGIDKIRINPGNIGDEAKVAAVVKLCKEKNIPIRIGVNSGSLEKGLEATAENMVKSAKKHVDILEKLDFRDIVISLKASDVVLAIEAYKLASEEFDYPLHIGITESGTKFSGTIKSSVGIGSILAMGIGDTIRVSLTGDPVTEIPVAKEILKSLNLTKGGIIVSCPTCGRLQYDMVPIAEKIEKYLLDNDIHLTIAVMGCAVNGPGEAKHADIGIAGGKGEVLLFKKGKIVRKIKEEIAYSELINEINLMYKKS